MAQVKSEQALEEEAEAKAAKAAAKMKPSYKHVPHSQKPPHLVAKRNARERRRVQAVNQAFYKLRKCVPIENRNKRVSKVKTLQRAIDYIRKLERILEEEDGAGSGPAPSCPVQQQGDSAPAQRRPRRAATNCDQIQQPPSDAQQQPQIIKQRRGRKPAAQSARKACAAPAEAQQAPLAPVPHPQESYEPPKAAEPHKFAEPYYQAYPESEVLRESSAYNSNLNYYAEPQYSGYLAPAEPAAPQPFDAYPQQPGYSAGFQYPAQSYPAYGPAEAHGWPAGPRKSERPNPDGSGAPHLHSRPASGSNNEATSGGSLYRSLTPSSSSSSSAAADAADNSSTVVCRPTNRQQVNSGYPTYASGSRLEPAAAHLSFAVRANNDNAGYQQQQPDGRKSGDELARREANLSARHQVSAGHLQAASLTANNLHEQSHYNQQHHNHQQLQLYHSYLSNQQQPPANNQSLSSAPHSANNLIQPQHQQPAIQEYTSLPL